MNRFMLHDLETGEVRDVVLDFGRTEQDARRALGGAWQDAERVVCHGPCRLSGLASDADCCG
jgi:hypothetical protein